MVLGSYSNRATMNICCVRIFIKQIGTGHYFKEHEVWVKERTDALEFTDSDIALEYCHKEKLRDVEIVLNQTGMGYDLRLPLGPNEYYGSQPGRRFL
jgi:hypothetical protein